MLMMLVGPPRVETKKEVPEVREKVSQEARRCSEIVGKLCQRDYWCSTDSKMQQYCQYVGLVHRHRPREPSEVADIHSRSRADRDQEQKGPPAGSNVDLGWVGTNLGVLGESFWESWIGLQFLSFVHGLLIGIEVGCDPSLYLSQDRLFI